MLIAPKLPVTLLATFVETEPTVPAATPLRLGVAHIHISIVGKHIARRIRTGHAVADTTSFDGIGSITVGQRVVVYGSDGNGRYFVSVLNADVPPFVEVSALARLLLMFGPMRGR